MEIIYKVEVSFPDGHIEELEVTFTNANEALSYANGILSQIAYTERGRQHDYEVAQEAYFQIKKIEGDKKKAIYDSRFGAL